MPGHNVAPGQDRKPYRSPAGTFEVIFKSFLEDQTLSNAEFRILAYLTTKPEDWKIRPKQLQLDLPLLSRHVIEAVLASLKSRDYLYTEKVRARNGKFTEWVTRYRRDMLIRSDMNPIPFPQVSPTPPESGVVAGDDITAGQLHSPESGAVVVPIRDDDYLLVTASADVNPQVSSTPPVYHSLVIREHSDNGNPSEHAERISENEGFFSEINPGQEAGMDRSQAQREIKTPARESRPGSQGGRVEFSPEFSTTDRGQAQREIKTPASPTHAAPLLARESSPEEEDLFADTGMRICTACSTRPALHEYMFGLNDGTVPRQVHWLCRECAAANKRQTERAGSGEIRLKFKVILIDDDEGGRYAAAR
jgi:hypothetical protein